MMPRWIQVGSGGVIDADRVVAVANTRSAPVKRWMEAVDPGRILNLTHGYPRRSVVLLDNDCLVLVSLLPDELARLLNGGMSDETG